MKDGIPTRDTAKNPLMKELVKTCPDIPPIVASQREECLKEAQTIIDCGKKLKMQISEEKQEKMKWRMKSEETVDSGIAAAIVILHQKRKMIRQFNLRRKRRICKLLDEIQMEISTAVHEVSRERELDEEMLQFEEEQQQLREQEQQEEAQVQEAQTQEGQGNTSV